MTGFLPLFWLDSLELEISFTLLLVGLLLFGWLNSEYDDTALSYLELLLEVKSYFIWSP